MPINETVKYRTRQTDRKLVGVAKQGHYTVRDKGETAVAQFHSRATRTIKKLGTWTGEKRVRLAKNAVDQHDRSLGERIAEALRKSPHSTRKTWKAMNQAKRDGADTLDKVRSNPKVRYYSDKASIRKRDHVAGILKNYRDYEGKNPYESDDWLRARIAYEIGTPVNEADGLNWQAQPKKRFSRTETHTASAPHGSYVVHAHPKKGVSVHYQSKATGVHNHTVHAKSWEHGTSLAQLHHDQQNRAPRTTRNLSAVHKNPAKASAAATAPAKAYLAKPKVGMFQKAASNFMAKLNRKDQTPLRNAVNKIIKK